MNTRIFGLIAIYCTMLAYATDALDIDHKDTAVNPLVTFTDELQTGGLGPEMIVIPIGGKKVENCIPKEVCNETITDIVRSMISSPYALSKYEITFSDYDRYCETTGRTKPDDNGWGRGSQPVIFVAWQNALAYVDWLTAQTGFKYRLPSVIEWEHAARAGQHTAYWWGPNLDINRANCGDCGSKWSQLQPAPVGSFSANPWGIYDMHGNVAEFTQDCAMKKRRFRISKRFSFNLNKLSTEPRFFRECEWIRLKGSPWNATYYSSFRKKTDQNNPYFPERYVTYPELHKGAAIGIRVVREL